MAKYYSFLLIASVWLFTVSCFSAANETNTPSKLDQFWKELLNGMTTFATDMTDISGSSNAFVKIMRDMADNMLAKYEKCKEQIQVAMRKGIEMEKKIQSLSQSLKKSTIPLTEELIVEIDAIRKHATSELKKLKGMENDRAIEGIEKESMAKHADIKEKIQELFRETLSIAPTAEETNTNNTKNATVVRTEILNLKTKVFALIHASVPVAFAAKNNEEKISNKMKTTYTTLSKIRNDLARVEQIQYDLLRGYKDHYGADAASLTRSLLTPCVFTILLGMLF